MLEVSDLDVRYGQAQALWDISLRVSAGEIVSIVGANGAGKSTLVNTIAGLLRPSGGHITMNGEDISHKASHKVCESGVAIVPEGRRILPSMTVRDNLDLGAYRRGAREHHAARLEYVYSLFPILRERYGQSAGTLSGGQQQMLAIARALMSGPQLLLLDEPSLGLAPVIVDDIFDIISEIKTTTSVCLVEQNVTRALSISDRGYVIQEGRVVLEDSSDRLATNDSVRQAYLGV